MEDHKKKSKKRNQNKRPTQDQIKKLQNTVEQRNNKVNGVLNEATHSTNSFKNYENSHKPELSVENHVSAETNGNKKSRKKIKQQKAIQKDNENGTETVNGHIEGQEVKNDHVNRNGVLHKVVIETVDGDSQAEENPPLINLETVAAALETVTSQTNESNACSHTSANVTSSCHQYHGGEAPMCSHHIQHHMNNINMGDFKIDFDVQKHLSPISSPLGSNKEYFYKGFNVEKLEAVNPETNLEGDKFDFSQKLIENNRTDIIEHIQESNSGSKIVDGNIQIPFGNVSSGTEISQSLKNIQLPFDPTALLKNMFADKQNQGVSPMNPDDMMKAMFGTNIGQAFDPQEMLKSMFRGGDKNINPPLNPAEMFSTMFKKGGPGNTGVNQQDVLKSMFGDEENQQTQPVSPKKFLINIFDQAGDKGGSNYNTRSLFDGMVGKKENDDTAPDPDDMQIPDMFSQINAMSQQMDPNLISNMGQIVANMDPALLMGVNNMVSTMIQGGELNLQTLMQMKANRLQKNSTKVEECNVNEPQKLDRQEKCLNEKDHNNMKENHVEPTQINEMSVKSSNLCEEKYATKTKEILKAEIEEETPTENNCSKGKGCNSKEEVEQPVMKCSFSFSSNTSEQMEESNIETKLSQQEDGDVEIKTKPKKGIRFFREESVPELIENLTKTDTIKEVKIDQIEIKTNKLKTIINKVFRKEKKSVNGNIISSIEVHEQRVEYQNKKEPSTANFSKMKEIDYEKLHYVKEPMEVKERKEMSSKAKDRMYQSSEQVNKGNETEKHENKVKKTGESNKDDIRLIDNTEQMVIVDNIEFNLDSMNDFFTNLLQGKNVRQETTSSTSTQENNISSNSPGSVSTDNKTFQMMMQQNMSNNIFNKFIGQQNLLKNEASGPNEVQSDKTESLDNVMSLMLNAFTPLSSEANKNPLNQTSNQAVLFQNLQQTLMQTFTPKNQEDGSKPYQGNIHESMTEMFDKMLSNREENSMPDFQDILSNEGNISEMLKVGEMFFGNNPIDPTRNAESIEKTAQTVRESQVENVAENTSEENDEDITIVHVSKNVYQHERTSVLLKELLGENFWSIRKKDDLRDVQNSKFKSEKKNKKNKSKVTPNACEIKTTTSSDIDNCIEEPSTSARTLPLELQRELEKESPLVRMLHKKIQKDTKLQHFLKEKLLKDPKMQKFIQERLQKDERIQKFMREKLSKDKALRKNFEEKFKNELGLTNIVPNFDDEEDVDEGPSDDNNEEQKKLTEESSDNKPENDVTKASKDSVETRPNQHIGLVFKTFAELTFLLIAIVYTAMLCY